MRTRKNRPYAQEVGRSEALGQVQLGSTEPGEEQSPLSSFSSLQAAVCSLSLRCSTSEALHIVLPEVRSSCCLLPCTHGKVTSLSYKAGLRGLPCQHEHESGR